jgi:hypothetical protein
VPNLFERHIVFSPGLTNAAIENEDKSQMLRGNFIFIGALAAGTVRRAMRLPQILYVGRTSHSNRRDFIRSQQNILIFEFSFRYRTNTEVI